MNTGKFSSRRGQHLALASLALAMGWAGTAHGAEYWLCAKSTDVTMPGGVTVPMWGYALDTAGFAGSCAAAPSVPGPALPVPAGEGLIVHLRNVDLPEPTSLVIPGQVTTMSPVRHAGNAFDGRVRSFAAEAEVGADQTYTWANLKPGTYLYHSGTHPQVQVQMGLYGALTHDASAGHAYAGVPYSNQVTVLFSEVDPVLHDAVDAGRYGQPVPNPIPAGLTEADYPSSTIDYAPKYFLINGAAYPAAGLMNLAAGNAGQTTLLRLLNAGLQSRSPVLQGMHMRLMAEDGNPSPFAREQYSVFLPALKTVDAVITPAAAASYPFYDRRLGTINPGANGSTDGGMLAFLQVSGPASGTPLAGNDAYATAEDTPLSVPIPGVLGNDDAGTTANWLSGPSHGSLSLLANGSFTYTPALNYNGADSFSYRALSGGVPSLPATVSLTVTAVNDRPIAANDTYSVAAGSTLTVSAPGLLGNDSDVDGQVLTAFYTSGLTGVLPLTGRSALNPNGSFTYTAPSTPGIRSFTYRVSDGTLTSAPATVTISVTAANQAPVAVNDTFNVARNASAVALNVLTNDTDANGNIAPATVVISTPPNKGGTVTVNANGTVSYTPRRNFRGTENFRYRVSDTAGALSNIATVRVNVK